MRSVLGLAWRIRVIKITITTLDRKSTIWHAIIGLLGLKYNTIKYSKVGLILSNGFARGPRASRRGRENRRRRDGRPQSKTWTRGWRTGNRWSCSRKGKTTIRNDSWKGRTQKAWRSSSANQISKGTRSCEIEERRRQDSERERSRSPAQMVGGGSRRLSTHSVAPRSTS